MKKYKIVFSDIHSNMEAVKKVESLKKAIPNSEVIFLGDLFDRGKEAKVVLNYFVNNCKNMEVLMGNHDEMLYILLGILEKKHYHLLNLRSFKKTSFDEIYFTSIVSFFANGGGKTLHQLFPKFKKKNDLVEKTATNLMYGLISKEDTEVVFAQYREILQETEEFRKLKYLCNNTSYYYVSDDMLFSHSSIVNDTWAKPYNDFYNYGFKFHIMGHQKFNDDIEVKKNIEITKKYNHSFSYGKLGHGRILIDNKKFNNVVIF